MNTQYWVRVLVTDERGLTAASSSTDTVVRVTGTTPPAAPVISCPAPYTTSGIFTDTVPAAPVSCTISAVGSGWAAPSSITVFENGVKKGTYPITPSTSSATAKTSYSVAATAGTHAITAYATNPAVVSSATTSPYLLGFGASIMDSPAPGTTETYTATVDVNATLPRPSGTIAGKLQWRTTGNTAGAWQDGPSLSVAAGDTGTGPVTFGGAWALSTVSGAGISPFTPVTVEARICVYVTSTPTSCAQATAASGLTRVPGALSGQFPTDSSSGVGTVTLVNGEFTTFAGDAAVAGVALARTYQSQDGTATQADTVRGVFGPGWSGGIDVTTGVTGWGVDDTTATDGRITLTEPEGRTLVFRHSTNSKTYAFGTYIPDTTETTESKATLELRASSTDAPNGAELVLTTAVDSSATVWAPTMTLPTGTPGTSARWAPYSTYDPHNPNGDRAYFTTTTAGGGIKTGTVVTVPAGVDKSDCPSIGTWGAAGKGCLRATYTYGATGLLTQVAATVWDPVVNAWISDQTLASYEYDSAGRLVRASDGRTGLSTMYGYDGTSSRLAVIIPPGQAPYRIWYVNDALLGAYRVAMITRDTASATSWSTTTLASPPAGSVALARYAYAVPVAGNGTALPALTRAGVDAWYQQREPVHGFGVFGPDFAWTGDSTTFTPPAATSSDWRYADLQYTSGDGSIVNTASYGTGRWLLASTDYDQQGRTIRTLAPEAIAGIQDSPGTEDPAAVGAMSSESVYNSDGLVTDEYGPVHTAVSSFSPLQGSRTHTVTTYNEGRPAGKTLDLVTSRAVNVYAVGAGGDVAGDLGTAQLTSIGYEPVAPGDPDGWDTGQATTTTSREIAGDGSKDIVRTSRYDAAGRIIETRQPQARSTTDAGTTRYAYYTAGAHPDVAACGNHVEWAGLLCQVWNGASPTSGYDLKKTITTYNAWGETWQVIETFPGHTRTTETTADVAGRPSTHSITLTSGAAISSTPRATTTIGYDPTTGLPKTLTAAGVSGAVTQGYDGWGRLTSYTNELGDTATTLYNEAGQVATVTDPKGTATYAYDGVDAAGKEEHRGVPTQLTVTRGGTAGLLTYKAAYNPAGLLTTEKMPGGITKLQGYNLVGQLTELTYQGQVTPTTETVDTDTGETTWVPGTPVTAAWLTWTRYYDIRGLVAGEYNGAGAAFEGVPGVTDPADVTAPTVGRALASEKQYTYDHAGRLTRVNDRTATSTGLTLEPGTVTPGAPCTVREYTFDKNGNRTRLNTKSDSGGGCSAAGAGTGPDLSYTYDSADHPLTAGATTGGPAGSPYTYDPLRRQTRIPASDAPDPTRGDITLAYYDDDLVRTISQGGVTTTYQLDVLGRRQTSTSTGAGAPIDGTTVRHYTDTGDSHAWTVGPTGGITRNSVSLSGVAVSIDSTGEAVLAIANPHGDNVTTITIPSSQGETRPLTAIGNWIAYDEYGVTASPIASSVRYGYLGQFQRETVSEGAGLILMGVRVYNSRRGAFTSADPIMGGNETSYGYPIDPINRTDLNGKSWWLNALLWTVQNIGPYPIRAACTYSGFAWSVCVGIGNGLLGALGTFLYARFADGRWATASELFWSFLYGVVSTLGVRYARSARDLLVRAGRAAIKGVTNILYRIGQSSLAYRLSNVAYWAIDQIRWRGF